jgi:hypothetical protein
MTVRIPPITTPVAGEGDDDDPRSINSLWYRYLQSLQQSIPGEGIPEAPEDGKLYGRQDAAWAEVPSAEDVDLSYSATANDGTVANTGGTGFVVPKFTRQQAGLVPAPVTGTNTRYLREDGAWSTASGTPWQIGAFRSNVSGPGPGGLISYIGGLWVQSGGTLVAQAASDTNELTRRPRAQATISTVPSQLRVTSQWRLSLTGTWAWRFSTLCYVDVTSTANTSFFFGFENTFWTGTTAPSTGAQDSIAIIADPGDATFFVMKRIGTGVATKTNTGITRNAQALILARMKYDGTTNVEIELKVYDFNFALIGSYTGTQTVTGLTAGTRNFNALANVTATASATLGLRWIAFEQFNDPMFDTWD